MPPRGLGEIIKVASSLELKTAEYEYKIWLEIPKLWKKIQMDFQNKGF